MGSTMTITVGIIALLHCLVVWANPVDQPDLFFGTELGGNMFPGATRPFGMVKMGVDVIDSAGGDAYSGFAPDGKIVAISMMHESGTGGAPQYGVAAQFPHVGAIDYSRQLYQTRSKKDVASPGHYRAEFKSGIQVEFSPGRKSGTIHYTFPEGSTPEIVVNGSAHLVAPKRPWWTQYFAGGSVEAVGPSNYIGHTTIEGGWGEQLPWTIYFCGEFDTPFTQVTSFQGHDDVKVGRLKSESSKRDDSMGIVFEFATGTRELYSNVGISFLSAKQACSNIADEITTFGLESLHNESVSEWENEVFDKVEISTDNDTISNWIYTALYGAHLLPSDRTGENPNWKSKEPYYDDWFTLWDTFRCLNPLFNVLHPNRGADMVRTLIDIYRHEGFMPDGRSANQNGRTQGGNNAEIVIADAFVKGVDNGFINWEEAFMAMRNDAEEIAPYVYDRYGPAASTKEGRGGIPEYLELGYVTRNYTRSVTRTMEYAYGDYAISVVARGLGKIEQADKFLKRSSNWKNIWNVNASSPTLNYTGFIQPRNANGSFNYENYDPINCGGCYWHDDEYEGTAIEYGWSVPHDILTLLQDFIGSNATFVRRLDDMFKLHGRGFADIGNEPSFLTPFLYNYVNQQYRTVETVRFLVNTYYKTGPTGLPGNSDAGSMQAWLFWSLIGLYPMAGTTTYLLSSPFLPSTVLNLESGTRLEITANSANFTTDYFVQQVTLNGETLDRNWVTHDEVFGNQSAWLHFELGSKPVLWETGVQPPSPGRID